MSNDTETPKNKGGRPTKYSVALANRLPDMFKNGESVAEVCLALEISKDTFYAWVKKHKRFSDAYKKGLCKSEAWWSRLGRAGSQGSVKIQPATWIFNMKNRFGWSDRIEQQHSGEVSGGLVIGTPISPDDWLKAAEKQQSIMKGARLADEQEAEREGL